MYSNTTEGQLWIVSKESFEMMGCPDGAALDVWCSWSVSTCCDSGLSCSIYSCSRTAERVLQRRLTLLFHFLVEQKNFLYDFHWAKQCYVRDIKVFGISVTSQINCHIAVHACVLSQPNHPPRISTSTLPLPKQTVGKGPIRTWSLHFTLPSTLIPNHVLLNYSNGANPMHFSLCNMYSCLWCSSAICRENPVIAIQY